MSKDIGQLVTTDTFQTLFEKTNEVITILKDNIVTASANGDITIGNATITGSFSANTLIGSLGVSTNFINPLNSSLPVTVNGKIDIVNLSNNIAASIYTNNNGGSLFETKSDNISWKVGLRGRANTLISTSFMITTGNSSNWGSLGNGVPDFSFSPAGIGSNVLPEFSTYVVKINDGGYVQLPDPGASQTPSHYAVRANRRVLTNNGITGGGELTQDLQLGLTGQARRLHDATGSGIFVRNTSGDIFNRSLEIDANNIFSITNANGVNGNIIFNTNYANTSEAQAGINTFKVMTPEKTRQSETQYINILKANTSQSIDANNNINLLTPLSGNTLVSNYINTNIANTSESLNSSNDSKLMTPMKTFAAIASKGWQYETVSTASGNNKIFNLPQDFIDVQLLFNNVGVSSISINNIFIRTRFNSTIYSSNYNSSSLVTNGGIFLGTASSAFRMTTTGFNVITNFMQTSFGIVTLSKLPNGRLFQKHTLQTNDGVNNASVINGSGFMSPQDNMPNGLELSVPDGNFNSGQIIMKFRIS